MQILIKNTTDILDDKLSLEQRGILITLLLLRDDDPKLTLAKFKAKTKMAKIKESLIKLHQNGYIKWSGYKNALKAFEKERVTPEVIEVIEFMNNLYKRTDNPKSESTIVNLRNRLQEHDVDTIKKVVANRYSLWKDDDFMSKYLTPQTIFRPSKFDKYLEETLRTQVGTGIVEAHKSDLKDGDELNSSNVCTFIGTDLYELKTYRTDSKGKRKGNGVESCAYGSNVIRMVKSQEEKVKRGESREFIYTYKSRLL